MTAVRTSTESPKANHQAMTGMRRKVLRSFIKCGVVTAEEAKTLPTVTDMKRAYYAAAAEVAQNIQKDVASLKGTVEEMAREKLQTYEETLPSLQQRITRPAYELAKSALGISLLTCAAKDLEHPKKEGEEIYQSTLINVIALRRTRMVPNTGTHDTELGDYDTFTPIVKHLPKRTTAPFRKRKGKAAESTPK